jgi:hypothetical protein
MTNQELTKFLDQLRMTTGTPAEDIEDIEVLRSLYDTAYQYGFDDGMSIGAKRSERKFSDLLSRR